MTHSTHFTLVAAALASLFAFGAPATGAPHKRPTAEQKEADRLFKNGVELFGAGKFTEALAEFQRAYEIAPAPIVLYNIAACQRELSHYSDAVAFYRRFLTEGDGKVPAARIDAARSELDGILAHTAHVHVQLTPVTAALAVDGVALDPSVTAPLILAPGEHKLVAHVEGKQDATRVIHVASGDEPTVELAPADLPAPVAVVEAARPSGTVAIASTAAGPVDASPKHFRARAAYGTDLINTSNTGAPVVGIGVALGSRVEVGVDVVLVAYAVMPSVRVRLVGDRLSLHAIGAVPIALETAAQMGGQNDTFVAGAGGLGVYLRATPTLGLHLEGYASFASSGHGTTFPAFIGGDVWF